MEFIVFCGIGITLLAGCHIISNTREMALGFTLLTLAIVLGLISFAYIKRSDDIEKERNSLRLICVEAGLATFTPVIEVTNFRLLTTSTINAENK